MSDMKASEPDQTSHPHSHSHPDHQALAQLFFNDGLLLIYSYLQLHEWNSSACTSHHWFHVASLSTNRAREEKEVTLNQHKLAHFYGGAQQPVAAATTAVTSSPSIATPAPALALTPPSLFDRMRKSFVTSPSSLASPYLTYLSVASNTDTAASSSTPSPWSLRHRITSIMMKVCSLDHLPRLNDLVPHLRSLKIESILVNHNSTHFIAAVKERSFVFPSSLTTLLIDTRDSWAHERLPPQVVDMFDFALPPTAAEQSSLTTLSLGIFDWSPKFAPLLTHPVLQHSLKQLTLKFGYDDSAAATRLLQQISQLSSLTVLRFNAPMLGHAEFREMRAMPTLLEFYAPGLVVGTSLLTKLQSLTPNLKILRGNMSGVEPGEYSGFQHLKEMIIHLFSTSPADEALVVHSLCTTCSHLPLESLRFSIYTFTDPQSWVKVVETFPLLTSLDFQSTVSDPFVPILSAAASSSELLHRLIHISITDCNTMKGAIMSELAGTTFKNLRHLSLLQSQPNPITNKEIIERFHRADFYSSLDYLRISHMKLDIEYDIKKGMNQCALDGNYNNLIKLERSKLPIELNEQQPPPPASRLVGIELNPGPIAILFNDGLMMVYSYLMTRDWNSAACTSCHWFTVACHLGRTNTIRTVTMYSRQLESLLSITSSSPSSFPHFSKGGNAAVTLTHQLDLQSHSRISLTQWSLRHRITHINIKVCPIDQLHLLVPLLPHIQEMKIMKIGSASNGNQWNADTSKNISIASFPSSLTSFTIGDSTTHPSKSSILTQYVIDWLVECVTPKEGHEQQCSLTSLSLSRIPIILRLFRLFDLPSLRTSLISLELTFDHMGTDSGTTQNASARTITMCSQFTQLATLRLDGLYLNDALTYMSIMPSLTELIASNLRIDPDVLTLLHKGTPILERLKTDWCPTSTSILTSYAGFTRLKEISLFSSSEWNETTIIETLCSSCTHLPLETIRFHSRAMCKVASWTQLTTTFPGLTHLIFEEFRADDTSLKALLSSSHLCQRLTSIDCYHIQDGFDVLFTQQASSRLINLRHLTLIHSKSSSCPIAPRSIYDQCNQSDFFPKLTYLKIVQEGIVIEYDELKRINRGVFNGKQMQIRVERYYKCGEQQQQQQQKKNPTLAIIAIVAPTPSPRLVGIELNPGPMAIDYNENQAVNYAIIEEMWMRFERNYVLPVASGVPPAPLVGIELNPGPISSLFNDGLSIVYTYLTQSEWNECARTSRHWFYIATTSIVGFRDVTIKRQVIPFNQSNTFHIGPDSILPSSWRVINRIMQFFSQQSFAPQNVPSRWSLRHLITSAVFVCSLDAVPRVIDLLPHLRSLEIHLPSSNPVYSSIFTNAIRQQSFIFPSSLTSLTIQSDSNEVSLPRCAITMFAFAFSASSSPHLTSLTLGKIYLDDSAMPLTQIYQNTSLRQSLTKLTINIQVRPSRRATTIFSQRAGALLQQVSQLKQLTHLTLINAIEINSLALTKMQPISTLKEFHASTLRLTSETLRILCTRIPAISILRGQNHVPIEELAIYALFTCLSEIEFSSLETESQFLNAICLNLKQLPLTSLRFNQSSFTLLDSWQLLIHTFPLLCELSFSSFYASDPLLTLMDPTITARWTKLTLTHCSIPRSTLLLILRHEPQSPLTSLKSLNLVQSVQNCTLSELKSFFDRPDFLPQLQQLEVRQMQSDSTTQWLGLPIVSQIQIEYDARKRLNRCTHNSVVTQLNRGGMLTPVHEIESITGTSIVPPPPRLVGIELNPGPTQVSLSNLFNDGLGLILSYLTTPEWNAGARVNRHFFNVASHSRLCDVTMKFRDAKDLRILEQPTSQNNDLLLTAKVGATHVVSRMWDTLAFWTSKKKLQEMLLQPTAERSEWSLHRRITGVSYRDSTFHLIPTIAFLLPHLRSLSLIHTENPDLFDESREPVQGEDVLTSMLSGLASLRHLSITSASGSRLRRIEQSLIGALAATFTSSSSLTSLTLGTLNIRNIDLASLLMNPHLQSSLKRLHLQFARLMSDEERDLVADLMQQVSGLISLTYLQMDDIWIDADCLTGISSMPTLREWHAPLLCLDSITLLQLYVLTPNIEIMRSDLQTHMYDVGVYTGFRSLREVQVGGREWKGTEGSKEAVQIDSLCRSCAHLPLTSLRFQLWTFSLVSSWQKLSFSFPSLTHLTFEVSSISEVNWMECVQQFPRLTRLTVFYSKGIFALSRLDQVNLVKQQECGLRMIAEKDWTKSGGIITEWVISRKVRNDHTSQSVIASTPAPRLVGIELNPGPLCSLFNDGLSIVFSFLTLSEWNSSALTSHHWFHVAIKPTSSRIIFSSSDEKRIALLLEDTSILTSRRWSLRHLITALDVECSFTLMPRLTDVLPDLRSFTLTVVPVTSNGKLRTPKMTLRPHPETIAFMLPATLESLSISTSSSYMVERPWIDSLAAAIPPTLCLTSLHLQHIVLGRYVSLTPLLTHPVLRSSLRRLHIRAASCVRSSLRDDRFSDSDRLVQECSQLAHLTHLTLSGVHLAADRVEKMSIMSDLIVLKANLLRNDKRTLAVLHARAPKLKSVSGIGTAAATVKGLTSAEQSSIVPLAPRLVGIELNPGPMATLFNDGLLSIYSFLDTHEWNAAARASKHWFHCAAIEQSNKNKNAHHITMHRLTVSPLRSLDFHLGAAKFSRMYPPSALLALASKNAVADSSFSLQHRIISAHFDATLDAVTRILHLIPQIRTLRLDVNPSAICRDEDKGKEEGEEVPPLNIPASLAELTLDSASSLKTSTAVYLPSRCLSFLGNAIIHASLSSLTLSCVSSSLDFSLLCENEALRLSLRTLKLGFEGHHMKRHISSFLYHVSHLSQLTHLLVAGLTLNSPAVFDRMSILPHLTRLESNELFLNSIEMMHAVNRVMPNLTSLPDRFDLLTIPSDSRLLIHLREIGFRSHPLVNGLFSYSKQDESFAPVLSAMQLSQLETIHFRFWCLESAQSWKILSESFPHLTDLTFTSMQFETLVHLEPVSHQLRKLTLIECHCITADQFIQIASKLTSLTHLIIQLYTSQVESSDERDVTNEQVISFFSDTRNLPSLQILRVDRTKNQAHSRLRIDYDEKRPFNSAMMEEKLSRFEREQQEQQEQIHHLEVSEVSPPQPRLVGIELNPGPSTSLLPAIQTLL